MRFLLFHTVCRSHRPYGKGAMVHSSVPHCLYDRISRRGKGQSGSDVFDYLYSCRISMYPRFPSM